MRFLIFADPHWSQNTSIVRTRGEKYSTRLENLILSMNWLESTAIEYNCECVICAGDFFDSTQLNSEEISALKEIKWNNLPHIFLTGNHEASTSSLEFSTLNVFELLPNANVISSPTKTILDNGTELCYLPYITEKNRKPIKDYFGDKTSTRIIISHNDLKGVQYGGFLSTEGFDVEDIKNNCDLFLNGHIHNCEWVTSEIINIGNLTGSAFTEDGYKYQHYVQIVDAGYELFLDQDVIFQQNPFAFNFFKLDFSLRTNESIEAQLYELETLHPVISATVTAENHDFVKSILDKIAVCYRLVSSSAVIKQELKDTSVFNGIDHLQQFKEFIKQTYGNNPIVDEELKVIMR